MLCAACRARRARLPYDVAIVRAVDGSIVALRNHTGWFSPVDGRGFARATSLALEHIAARDVAAPVHGYRALACPTEAGAALTAMTSALLASELAAADGMVDRSVGFAVWAILLASAAEISGAERSTIMACRDAARATLRRAPRAGGVS